MKKIFLFISPLIAFFLGGFILYFNCKAEALPSLSNDTISLVLDGNESLTYSAFSSYNLLPINVNPTLYYNMFADMNNDPLITGARLNTMETNDYTVSALTQSQIDALSQNVPYLYDVNGNVVQWENVYYVTYMNGMFHGNLYVDGNGNILTLDINNTKTAFKLGLGGYLLGVTDIANIYSDIATLIPNQEFNYALNQVDLSNSDISLYYLVGCRNSRRTELNVIYVPNVYAQGFCISPEDPSTFYFNDGYSPVIYAERDQVMANYWTNPRYKDITYQHAYNFGNYFRNGGRINYSTFLTLSDNRDYLIDYNGFTFDSSLWGSGDDIISFKKLEPLPSTKQLQFTDDYDYNHIKELEQSLDNTTSTPDTNFNPSEGINELNYPLIFEIPETTPDSEPSELPFPESVPEPEPMPMPDPATAPSIGSDIGEINPSELRSTIPIINNLLNRFPFSIPWDIYGLLSGLSVQRETPYINTTIHIPCIDYDWVLDYDLSDFDGIASLFRTLFLIAFILGLAYFSYDHFFGS